jgi:hypothetical protein
VLAASNDVLNCRMATSAAAGRQICLRLIHDGVQPGTPLEEPMQFGLQDAKGEVHPGIRKSGNTRHFDLTLEVSGNDKAGRPGLRGPFAWAVSGSLSLSELEARGQACCPLGVAHQNPFVWNRVG